MQGFNQPPAAVLRKARLVPVSFFTVLYARTSSWCETWQKIIQQKKRERESETGFQFAF